jgi:hypothetical protein
MDEILQAVLYSSALDISSNSDGLDMPSQVNKPLEDRVHMIVQPKAEASNLDRSSLEFVHP